MRRPDRARDSSTKPREAAVTDALFAGHVRILQPARGYRVNVDTLILAHFAAETRPVGRHVVDLGSGVGALAIAYAHFARAERSDLVERERSFAALARKNLDLARIEAEVHVQDLERHGLPDALRGTGDVVLANPPFFGDLAASGRSEPVRQRARHGRIEPFLKAASTAMGRRAYAFFVYPASAIAEFLQAALGAGLVAKRMKLVHPFADSPARLALFELRRAKPGGLVVAPPLIEWTARGVRTGELERIVGGKPQG